MTRSFILSHSRRVYNKDEAVYTHVQIQREKKRMGQLIVLSASALLFFVDLLHGLECVCECVRVCMSECFIGALESSQVYLQACYMHAPNSSVH